MYTHCNLDKPGVAGVCVMSYDSLDGWTILMLKLILVCGLIKIYARLSSIHLVIDRHRAAY